MSAKIYLKATLPNRGVAFYFFDSTATVKVSRIGRLTESPLQNGETASDSYITDGLMISLTGRITDIKTVSRDVPGVRSTTDFISGLEAVRQSELPISVQYQVGMPEADNCFILNLDTTQSSEDGYAGDDEDGNPVNSILVDITLKQTLYARGARITATPNPAYRGLFQDKKTTPTNAKKTDETNEMLIRGYLRKHKAELEYNNANKS